MGASNLDYMRTYGCEAAGCTDPAYAERGLHASNCTQSEIDHALDRLQALSVAAAAVLDGALTITADDALVSIDILDRLGGEI